MRAMTNGANGAARLMKIGEVSRRSGVSIRALRFYERIGLLAPAARRPSGYRLYGERELHHLAFIRQARALGFTLASIRPLIATIGGQNGGATRAGLVQVLGERIQHTTDQLERLTDLRAELERRRRALVRTPHADRPRGYCTCLEKRSRGR
jgi:MerR family copper efflux transcriptional regulator